MEFTRIPPALTTTRVVVVAAVVLAAVAGVWQLGRLLADDPAETVARADDLTAADTTPAAIVNGVVITRGAIAGGQLLLGAFPANELSTTDTQGLLEFAIREELLAQEAARRGLMPSDDEVTEAIKTAQEGLQADLSAGKLPQDVANIIEGQRRAGHPIEGWTTDPAVRQAYTRALARAALTRTETADIAATAPGRDQLVEERMDRLVAQLRERGDVEVFLN